MITSKQKLIVLVGGSGFLGRALAQHFLSQSFTVVTISRSEPRLIPGERFVAWDAKTIGPWTDELEGAEAVINLAGRSVDCRYTKKNRQEMLRSRVDSTRVLGEAIAKSAEPPRVWLNASTATIYRNAYDSAQSESAGEIGKGFSVEIAKAWEAELFNAKIDATRTRRVALRAAMVMGNTQGGVDGVWDTLSTIVRLGLGGRAGSGKQFFSWLHVADFTAMVDWIITHEEITGAVNLAAPDPRPNAEFMRLLRRSLGVHVGLPAPEFLLELGAVFLRTETELLLKSRRVVPEKLLASGYRLRFPTVEAAFADLVSPG